MSLRSLIGVKEAMNEIDDIDDYNDLVREIEFENRDLSKEKIRGIVRYGEQQTDVLDKINAWRKK